MTKAREIAELGQKLTVDASGNIDVAGIVTADQLTVYNGTSDPDVLFRNNGTGDVTLTFRRGAADDVYTDWSLINDNGTFTIRSDNSSDPDHTQLTLTQGDISFYDTSGNAKFFWDASGEVLGLGTDTPNTGAQLHVDGGSSEGSLRIEGDTNTKISQFASTTGSNFLYFGDTDSYNSGQIRYSHSNDTMTIKATDTINFQTGVSERLRITSDGEVHINSGDISTGSGTNKALLQVANIDTTSDWSAINTGENAYASTANEIAVLNTANQDLNGFAGIFFQAGEAANSSAINSARIGAIKTSTSGTNTDLAFASRNGSAQMVEHLRIKSDGKIGLGTDSPTGNLSITGGNPNIRFDDDDTSSNAEITLDNTALRIEVDDDNLVADSAIKFQIDGSTSAIITDTGRFGIGDTNPVSTLEISNEDQTNGTTLTITNAFSGGSWAVDDIVGTINFRTDDGSTSQPIRGQIQSITDAVPGSNWPYGTALTFSTAYNNTLSEAFRVDSSGNLLVGTTSTSLYNDNTGEEGFSYKKGGSITCSRNSAAPLFLNRQTNDGRIIDGRKNGSAVGGLGVYGNNIVLDGYYTSSKAGLSIGGSKVTPRKGESDADDAVDLGSDDYRWRHLYLSGGAYIGGTVSSNHLDDYEEGSLTWRLYKVNHSGTGSNNTATNVKYVKIGRLVTITGYIRTDGTNGSSGTIAMTGTLPYSPSHHVTIPITHTRSVVSGDRDEALSIMCAKATTGPLYIYENDDDNDYTAAENNVGVNAQTNLVITFQGSYYTSQ